MAQLPPSKTPKKHPSQPTGSPVSAQRYLDVAQIRDGVVVLRDGSLRALVLVNAVNFALKSEEEQNALVFAYQGFLNSFSFPIQIVMQSRQLDLAHYVKKLEDRLAETTNELVQLQINDYIQFIERLIQVANIMDKKFYLVVPFTPQAVRQRGFFDKLFNPGNRLEVRMSPAEFKAYRQELLERSRIIMAGLASVGLRSALLGTQETIELLYATYNPEEATKERLSSVESITGSLVKAEATAANPGDGGRDSGTATVPQPTNPMAEVAPEGQELGVGGSELGKTHQSDVEPPNSNSGVQDQMPNQIPDSNVQVVQTSEASQGDQAHHIAAEAGKPSVAPNSQPQAPEQPLVQPTGSLALPEPLALTTGPVREEAVAPGEQPTATNQDPQANQELGVKSQSNASMPTIAAGQPDQSLTPNS